MAADVVQHEVEVFGSSINLVLGERLVYLDGVPSPEGFDTFHNLEV